MADMDRQEMTDALREEIEATVPWTVLHLFAP